MLVNYAIGYKYLGFVPYVESIEIQKRLHQAVINDELETEGYILLLYHEPVITFGKYSSEENLLVEKSRLSNKGINIYRSTRGGDITCHEPGQLVVYPVLNLKELNLGVKEYVRNLESLAISFLNEFNIKGEIVDKRPGVWVGTDKIASIGINISKFVTTHGIAINVNNSLETFKYVNPCGFTQIGMTSIKKLTGKTPDLEASSLRIIKYFQDIFNLNATEYETGFLVPEPKNQISSSAS